MTDTRTLREKIAALRHRYTACEGDLGWNEAIRHVLALIDAQTEQPAPSAAPTDNPDIARLWNKTANSDEFCKKLGVTPVRDTVTGDAVMWRDSEGDYSNFAHVIEAAVAPTDNTARFPELMARIIAAKDQPLPERIEVLLSAMQKLPDYLHEYQWEADAKPLFGEKRVAVVGNNGKGMGRQYIADTPSHITGLAEYIAAANPDTIAMLIAALASREAKPAPDAVREALKDIAGSADDDDGWTSDGHERCTEAAAAALDNLTERDKTAV